MIEINSFVILGIIIVLVVLGFVFLTIKEDVVQKINQTYRYSSLKLVWRFGRWKKLLMWPTYTYEPALPEAINGVEFEIAFSREMMETFNSELLDYDEYPERAIINYQDELDASFEALLGPIIANEFEALKDEYPKKVTLAHIEKIWQRFTLKFKERHGFELVADRILCEIDFDDYLLSFEIYNNLDE